VPLIYGNSTVIVRELDPRRNCRPAANAEFQKVGPWRGKQQHIVATLLCKLSIYDPGGFGEGFFDRSLGSRSRIAVAALKGIKS
jgi:hypothetical protein